MPPDAITAGRIRSWGVPISAEVPDCAWVRRESMKVTIEGSEPSIPTDEDIENIAKFGFVIKYLIYFYEPFYWVTLDCVVKESI